MVNLERVGVNLTVDQKHVLLTVLGIGVSFGVGLGVNKWRNHDMAVQIKDVLHELIVDGKHVKDTFKEFPHYLRLKLYVSFILFDQFVVVPKKKFALLS